MTVNIKAVMQAATLPFVDNDLWETYRTWAYRPLGERLRMRRALVSAYQGAVVDMRELFCLNDAYFKMPGTGLVPGIAMAPLWTNRIWFTSRMGLGRFFDHEPKYVDEPKHRWLQVPIIPNAASASLTARVPPVPKSVAPRMPWITAKTAVLFDADWQTFAIDPYLLERVRENQYKVVAEWEVTEKERRLMAMIHR